MNRLSLCLFLLLAACSAAAQTTGTQTYRLLDGKEQQAFFQKIETDLLQLQTLQTSFTQRRHLDLFEDVLEAKGVCYFEAPESIRWEMRTPYPSMIIHHESEVGRYEKTKGNWRSLEEGGEMALRESLRTIMRWMRGDFAAAAERFDMQVFEGPDYRIVMKPRDTTFQEMVSSIELWARPEDYRMDRVIIREPSGDYVEIQYGRQLLNAPLPEGIFEPVEEND